MNPVETRPTSRLTLEEVCSPLAHPSVDVCLSDVLAPDYWTGSKSKSYLGGFDVVVKVVTEDLNVGNVFIASLRCQMAREKNYSRSVEVARQRERNAGCATYQM